MKRLVFTMTFLTLAGAASAFDIKGVTVDKPADCKQLRTLGIPLGRTVTPCEEGVKLWQIPISFLDGNASMVVAQSEARRILSLYVTDFDFALGLQAFTTKYGQPKIVHSVIQNRAGASFDQIEATWQDGAQTLYMAKHSSRIGRSQLILTGAEHEADVGAKQKDKASKALGNM